MIRGSKSLDYQHPLEFSVKPAEANYRSGQDQAILASTAADTAVKQHATQRSGKKTSAPP